MRAPRLSIRLFGALEVRVGDAMSPPLDSARAESLLAYVLLHPDTPVARQGLAFLLWPESTESQAQTNLRHLLHRLRRAGPALDEYLEVTPRTLRWRADLPCWVDVTAFDAAIVRAARETSDGALAALQEAVELYRGDLLEGCYDEWLLGERERRLQDYLSALERLAELLEARGDRPRAIRFTEQLVRRDPLREQAYCRLMRLHDGLGDRTGALRVYHTCATTLERELGVEPSAATRELYEALLPPRRAAGGQAERPTRPPLVARTGERARLADLWRAAERGRAQFVLVSGEPGIGKTRLVEHVRAWCAQRGATTVTARAYAAEGALAYGPVVDWLRALRLSEGFRRLDRSSLAHLGRLLPELAQDAPELPPPSPQSPDEQRQQLFDAITRAILATDGALLLVADDVHWYDRETLQLLHYLLRVAPNARLLVAATARREELVAQHPLHELVAGLRQLERYAEIELGRLSPPETRALAESLAGHPLSEAAADQLFEQTEGSPLFIVEALRAGWQPGLRRDQWLNPKVQAVIEARIAQLSPSARELVGVAATIGREFKAELLARASDLDETAFVLGLDELWQRRIVREQGLDAYDFSHDTIREVAYLSLSPIRRRQHHLRVAQALERVYAHDVGPISGQLAAHYDRSGAAERAIEWYRRAAEVALQLHASPEAIRLLERALVLLRGFPESRERHEGELALLTVLPAALNWVYGFQSTRLAEVQRRALELTQVLGREPHPPLLRSLAGSALSANDFGGARRFARQLRARGERDGEPGLLVEAEYLLGVAAFWIGQFADARAHLEAAIGHFHPEHRRAHLLTYAQDPEVICLNRLACVLWYLGYSDAAMQARERSLALAEEVGHPHTHSLALVFAALLAIEAHQPEQLRQFVATLATYSGGPDQWHAGTFGELLGGYVDVLDGNAASGLARIQRTIDDAPAIAPAPGQAAIRQRVLLGAREMAGDARAGLAAAERLLALGEAAGLWQAEAHRMRADFRATLGCSDEEVAAELEQALGIARNQGARSLELRAATSLLRHRVRHRSPALREAYDRLVSVVHAFGEGRDGHDLRVAANLLARC